MIWVSPITHLLFAETVSSSPITSKYNNIDKHGLRHGLSGDLVSFSYSIVSQKKLPYHIRGAGIDAEPRDEAGLTLGERLRLEQLSDADQGTIAIWNDEYGKHGLL